MKVTKEYEWNEVVWKDLNIGDSVQLPEFTVPKTVVGGGIELLFKEQTVKDTATVYDIKDDKIYLVFDHALFNSAMDLNTPTEWKRTQLHDYLSGAFKNSMKDVGIPVSKVSLLSKDDVFGKKALPFFKNGRNRIAFMKDDSCSIWYWLKNVSSASNFCGAYGRGYAYCNDASHAYNFVRPCFIVKKEEQEAV